MSCPMALDKIWIDKPMYDEAERKYCEKMAQGLLTPLAGEVAKARQRLIEIKDTFNNDQPAPAESSVVKNLENRVFLLEGYVHALQDALKTLSLRVDGLESNKKQDGPNKPVNISNVKDIKKDEEDDDVDLFGSDSEEDEAADKVREERLAAYTAKKSKKPALIAKSNIILDVKPWDDETDMKKMEELVRKIEMDGLLWGAAKLVPLAFGIHKLQISCVVEDEKVSVDVLQEEIEAIEDFVQSVDIAAFNKV